MNVLLSRRETMRLLILSELVKNKNCSQRDLAKKFGLTPQAISEHFKDLIGEGFVTVIRKGYYQVTDRGIEWLTKNLLDLYLFSEELTKKLFSRSIVALASGDIDEGEEVVYWFQDGYTYAKAEKNGNGIALTSAKDGEDVLIKATKWFRPPKKGEIIIVKVPDVGEGGSRRVNVEELRKLIKSRPRSLVLAIGVEALVACRKAGVEPIFFGAKEVCVEAAHQGGGVIVVCTENMLNDLLRKLIDEELEFKIKELIKES